MGDDPFAEPGDTEATVYRPRPAGTTAMAPAAAPAQRGEAAAAKAVPRVGANALLAAASPVLAAIIRITGDRGPPPDPEKLRTGMVRAIRRFETDALATGLDRRSLQAARYALCTTIDDLVRSTPWGRHSSWMQQSLTGMFHQDNIGGEQFFTILEKMQTDLGHHAEVVELMYLCTALGFEGVYRVQPRGVAALAELRDGIYRTLRQRSGDFERELSPHWQGVAAGARSLGRRIPLWARAVATLAIAGAMYLAFDYTLAGKSDLVRAELANLPPHEPLAARHSAALRPEPARPPATPQGAAPPLTAPTLTAFGTRLHEFLAPEIRDGLVQVVEDAQTVTVSLLNRNMFASGTAALGANYPALLGRIGDELNAEPGQVTVRGYTDNQPIRTPRFPSNYELSQARADVIAGLLRARLKDPGRVRAEGKGDADPIASNATAEGRQQNRRTEIVIAKTGATR